VNDYQSAVAEVQEGIDIMQFVIQMRIKLAHIELLSDCLQESAEKEQLPAGWVAMIADTITRDVKVCQANLEKIQ
jgi:hypothetical protein